MFDLKKVDVKSLRQDLIKNAVVIILARLIKFYVIDRQGDIGSIGDFPSAFNQEFVYSAFFLLIGFAVFWVVVEPYARSI